FGDKIQFLSVTYQKKEEDLPFLTKLEQVKEQRYHLPVIADDKDLQMIFPHKQLPHYVWIANGAVEGITGYEEVNSENIQAVANNEPTFVKAKADAERQPYDRKKPLFVNGNGGNGEAIKFHSILAGYTPGLKGSYNLQ